MTLVPAHTYSIVARDPETEQLGVAVQSHYFNVGSIVTWAQAGVGVVATQSFAEISYGPLGLALLRAGKSAEQTLTGLLAADPQAQTRQVAMADAQGNVATHTGSKCIEAAGHRQGAGYSVQANLMARDTVWDAMAGAYEGAGGDLAERLMVALEAAEAEGGDIRGKQSAALLVVSGELMSNSWGGRIFDLRVDDHPEPLPELRRLLAIARAYKHADEAEQHLVAASESGDEEHIRLATEHFDRAVQLMPGLDANPEPLYWYAVSLTTAGKIEDALPLFRTVFASGEHWRELVPRLVKADLLPNDREVIAKIVGL
jgi:uncharacterized Ntn-hydrolase superfamily protein